MSLNIKYKILRYCNMDNLMSYTSSDLKELIHSQLPNLKNFKKKSKELLIDIIRANDLDISNLKPLVKKSKGECKLTYRRGDFTITF